ncbi:related to cyclin CCL1 [Cephalotrichum gorgonifer]|uniref:Related to cyclin CCL1 n=1 Tax=Cephalotrichum gorgonifer TaxID=2041049 RepID=A0AAE8MSE6_9PEZI|nr:related to cyclin CCL1 [Cephalotrichum gorgonifer]
MDPTEDLRYRQSTQFRLWSYTTSTLAALRAKTNSLATTHIESRLQPVPEFLTPDEEAQLLKFFTVELLRAAAFCELPTEIRASAAVHMRRFYVTNSVMTYSPTDLLKTCLFFGSKGEGFYERLSKFAEKFPNTTAEEVVAGEFLLCQGIRFCFDVRHPFRALEGVILELRRLYPDENTRIEQAHARARHILKFSPLITDAYFHYTPSQIMFASLSMADKGLADRLLERTFSFPQNGKAEDVKPEEEAARAAMREKILRTIESCRAMLETEPPERMDEYWGTPECNKTIRPLLKKLRKCRDPDRADLVALQRARREQVLNKEKGGKKEGDGGLLNEESEEAREAKRRRVGLEDPFGPSL